MGAHARGDEQERGGASGSGSARKVHIFLLWRHPTSTACCPAVAGSLRTCSADSAECSPGARSGAPGDPLQRRRVEAPLALGASVQVAAQPAAQLLAGKAAPGDFHLQVQPGLDHPGQLAV
jgi:hypothetical protein